ncbi:MAG: tyrosine-type recombinase/integrase [Candidatus Spyradenecus sp.]
MKRFAIGRKSQGITEAFCAQEKARILNTHRFGDEVAAQLQKVKQADPTFGELFEWYVSKRDLKASTVEHLQILRKVPFWSARKVTRDEVQAYLDEMVAQGRRPATVTLRYRQLRAVYRYAIARGKYKHADPTVGIDLPKSTGGRKRYLTPEEIGQLLAAVRGDARLHLFVKMSLCTGARIGTLLSVHSDHIQPDGTVALYNHKGGRWYTGFLDAETMALLDGKRGYVLALKGKEDRVPAMQSIQYKVQAVMNELFNTPDTPKEERAVVHSIRHSVASRMLDKEVPMEVISKTLDHSSVAVTSTIYAHVSPAAVKRGVTNLWD